MRLPPAANARDGKRRRVVVDADTDPARVGAQIVDPVGNGPPQFRHARSRAPAPAAAARRPPFAAGVLEVPRRVPSSWCRQRSPAGPARRAAWTRAAMCSNWALRSGWPRALDRLAVALQAVASLPEQHRDHPVAGPMALAGQFGGQAADALARPPQRRLRIFPRGRLDQPLQVRHQRGVLVDRALAPPAGAANPPRRQGRRPARLQLLGPGANGPARYPRRPRHGGHATHARCRHFRRGHQPAQPFVQVRLDQPKPSSNCLLGHHPWDTLAARLPSPGTFIL